MGLVAALTKRLGSRYLELIEDVTQQALVSALTSWGLGEPPEDQIAWLYRVAYNRAIDVLRRDARLTDDKHAPVELTEPDPTPAFSGEVRDDMLRMLFVCCDPNIPDESQLALIAIAGKQTDRDLPGAESTQVGEKT